MTDDVARHGEDFAPHAEAVSTVADVVAADIEHGLDDDEAAHRLERDGPNVLAGDRTISWVQRLLGQFRDPLVLLLLAAILISLLAWYFEDGSGWPVDAIVIAVIVVMNAGLGAFQEHRADQAVAALSEMTAGRATVIRSGRSLAIAVDDVVVGDLLVVHEGDVIAADARVITSESLLVAEAALTGESVPVAKSPEPVGASAGVGDRHCMVHAGTAAVSGHARALVTATAMQTEVGRIADMLVTTEQLPTPLEREIRQVSRFLGLAVIVIAAVISVVIAVNSTIDSVGDLVEVLIIAVSVAVAAVPEGLPAVLSIVLAIGVGRMARQHALVKRLASAETLGAATVICTDKTGTLTQNRMQVSTVVTASGRHDHNGETSRHPAAGQGQDATTAANNGPGEHQVLVAAAAASNVDIVDDDGGWRVSGDPTETALVDAAHDLGVSLNGFERIERVAELPFSAERKRMSVIVRGLDERSPTDHTLVAKGAPEVLIDRCCAEMTADGAVGLTAERRTWWQHQTSRLADQAMRTLLVATRAVEPGSGLDEAAEVDLAVLGLIGIMDPPRAEVADAIATAKQAGVQVIMLTGDHPRTGASIAASLGIGDGMAEAITGDELDGLDDDELADLLDTHSVFARVAPAHKLRMVQVLQGRGHVVAMTGDGVNDAPALKAADIGTAMGHSGTEVAREAADMVLTDDNFSTIVAAVEDGRTIFRNVKSFLRYLLSSNVGEVLTIFLGVVFAGLIGVRGDGAEIVAPLTAAQILWINLLTDSGPAFALGIDPGDPNVMHDRPRRPGDRVIDAAMQRGIAVVGLTMALATLVTFDAHRPGGLIDGSGDLDTARTAAFTVLVFAQLFNAFSARSDIVSARVRWSINPWLLGAVMVSLALQVAVVHLPVLQRAFGTVDLSLTEWLLSALVASSVLVAAEIRKWFERRHLRLA